MIRLLGAIVLKTHTAGLVALALAVATFALAVVLVCWDALRSVAGMQGRIRIKGRAGQP
jgi:hypothetical protein